MNADQFLPVVRSRFYHEAMRLEVGTQLPSEMESFEKQQAYQVLAAHLAVALAVDHDDQIQLVTQMDLDAAGLSLEGAIEKGMSNLKSRFPRLGQLEKMADGFYGPSEMVPSFGATAVLRAEGFQKLPVSGRPVLFLPTPEIFWVAGEHDASTIGVLCELTIQEIIDQTEQRSELVSQPVTPIPFVLDGGSWQPWQPAPRHPSYRQVRDLWLMHESMVYEQQQQLLRQLLEPREDNPLSRDVHVASYQLFSSDTTNARIAEAWSLSVWTDSVDSLLPKTDVVRLQPLLNQDALASGATRNPEFGKSLHVSWETLEKHVDLSNCLVPEGMYPQRYRVSEFPDSDRWNALLAEAIPLPEEVQPTQKRFASDRVVAGSSAPRTMMGLGCLIGCGSSVALVALLLIVFAVIGGFRALPRPGGADVATLRSMPMQWGPESSEFEDGLLAPSGAYSTMPLTELGPPEFPDRGELPALVVSNHPSVKKEPAGFAGHPFGTLIGDQAPPGGVLVGLRLIKGRSWNGAIRAMQPIYQVGQRYHWGKVCGPNDGVDHIVYLAKPGYAIHRVRAQVGLAINAIQIEFACHAPDCADEQPTYRTRWFGCVGGDAFDLIGGPFSGIQMYLGPEEPCALELIPFGGNADMNGLPQE